MNNILLLIPDKLLQPMGGMGEQAQNLLTHFPDGYFFHVIGSADSEEYHASNHSFYPVMDMKTMNGNPEPLSSTFLNQSLLVQKALSINCVPDAVHAFDWSTFWAGRILAKHFNVPLITTVQLSIEHQIKEPHPVQKPMYDMACAIETSGLITSDEIIQVSENYANLFPKFLRSKTTVIHNGINLNDWQKTTDVKLPGNNPIKIIYIGRFAPMKNIQALLRCKIPADIDLIFIGDSRGGSSDLFDAMVVFCQNTPNAHYVGPLYGQDKMDWLFAADAVIVPSVHEPFGIVALEALASRSILLSSFVNGMADFLTENCAINCGTTVSNIENSFNVLRSLTINEKETFIQEGLQVCNAHSWSLQATKLATVYEHVLNK